jgi:hypothetical protein
MFVMLMIMHTAIGKNAWTTRIELSCMNAQLFTGNTDTGHQNKVWEGQLYVEQALVRKHERRRNYWYPS